MIENFVYVLLKKKKFDVNRDGTLDASELALMMSTIGEDLSVEEVSRNVHKRDVLTNYFFCIYLLMCHINIHKDRSKKNI